MTVDELIVRLALDATGLKQGAKEAQAAADKLATGLGQSAERGEKAQADSHKRTATSATLMGKSIVDSNQKVSQSFEGVLRTGLAFLAIFTGAKSVEDFTRKMVALNAEVGRMSHNVGSTPERVSALAQAVARSGGTFEGATSAIQGLSDAYQELISTGTNGIMQPLSQLQSLGGKSISLGNDWHKTLLQVADDLKVLDKTNPQLADSLGRKILGDQGLTNLAKGGSEAILAAEERSRQHGVITKEQAESAQKAQAAWADLNQSVTSFGNTLVTDLEPDITSILGKMDQWIDANKGWVAGDIKADIEAFGQTLKDHKDDIKRFGDELMAVVGVAGKIAVAFAAQGPAAQALELFAALIGTRILGPLGLARAALGLGLLNPATIGAGAVVGVLASGDPNKAMLDGGIPDANPRQNDLGLPGLDSDKDIPGKQGSVRSIRAQERAGESVGVDEVAGPQPRLRRQGAGRLSRERRPRGYRQGDRADRRDPEGATGLCNGQQRIARHREQRRGRWQRPARWWWCIAWRHSQGPRWSVTGSQGRIGRKSKGSLRSGAERRSLAHRGSRARGEHERRRPRGPEGLSLGQHAHG